MQLELKKKEKSNKQYSRKTAELVLENVIKKIHEVNKNEEFIYQVQKAILFGSYINSAKEKIGDLDIAIYLELKNEDKSEIEQNRERAKKSGKTLSFLMQLYYGKEEVIKYIKNKKHILQLHDGFEAEKEAEEYTNGICYIYVNKYKVIYELSN